MCSIDSNCVFNNPYKNNVDMKANKVQKIREEVERLKSQLLRGACSSQVAMETRCKEEAYNEVLGILDFMQEEPLSNKTEKAIDELSSSIAEELRKQLKDNLKEEPVSEDLEKEIDRCILDEDMSFEVCARHFANWQKEQFEKNRLKHCDSITNEQAELEQGFIDQHLDKYQRMPTFLDAIEYGMKLKEQQLMAKAVDGDITFDYYGDDDKIYGCIAHNSFCLEDFGLEDRDKVKVIVIKEEEV